jgi:hypothetical protein|tara:strand:- start:117 stop:902 length:786 start_codon:yes stop_codon:yes gene_type:complete
MELEKRVLNNGTIITFNEGSHRYTVMKGEEKYKPRSVTGILKVAFDDFTVGSMAGRKNLRETLIENIDFNKSHTWKKEEFEEFLKDVNKQAVQKWTDGALRGTLTHNFMQDFAEGKNPNYSADSNISKLQKSTKDWFESRVKKVFSVEQLVFNDSPMYAGKYDLEADIEDYGRCLVDYKTGSSLAYSQKYPIQLVAYMYAMLQNEPSNPFGRLIVFINKETGNIEERYYDAKTYQRDLSVWLSILNISNYTIDYKNEWKKK